MIDTGFKNPESSEKAVPPVRDSESRMFHITHWKAGSQWVRKVLRRVCNEAVTEGLPTDRPVPFGIYTPVYMHRDWFYA